MREVIKEMLNRGWSYSIISLRTGITENRLRDCNLGVREERRLYEVAATEAGIDLDDLEGVDE
ncbi:hypothetical protein D3C71_1674380 [compost metagenome]